MSRNYCAEEQRVFEAVQSGNLDAALTDHIGQCALCAEVALIAKHLRQPELEVVTLPDAGLLWWKAQLRARDAALDRATRPIAVVAKIGSAAAVFAAIWFAATPSAARDWISKLVSGVTLQSSGSPYLGELALLSGIGTVLCALIGSVLVLRD